MTAEGGDVELCAQEALAVHIGTGIDQSWATLGSPAAAAACSGVSHRCLRLKIMMATYRSTKGADGNICRLSLCY